MSQYPGQQPQDGYGQQEAAPAYSEYADTPPGVAPGPAPGPAGGRKKRRDYAGQAYEFGAGGNAAGTPVGHQDDKVSTGGYSLQQNAAGYAQGGYVQNPAAVQTGQTPMYGQSDAAGVGGYQPPAPGYPAAGGVSQLNQQMGAMGINERPAQPPLARGATTLNQLYPTDLLNQPLNVAELDYPPPPIILPPNVSSLQTPRPTRADHDRLRQRPLRTPTARPRTCDRP